MTFGLIQYQPSCLWKMTGNKLPHSVYDIVEFSRSLCNEIFSFLAHRPPIFKLWTAVTGFTNGLRVRLEFKAITWTIQREEKEGEDDVEPYGLDNIKERRNLSYVECVRRRLTAEMTEDWISWGQMTSNNGDGTVSELYKPNKYIWAFECNSS